MDTITNSKYNLCVYDLTSEHKLISITFNKVIDSKEDIGIATDTAITEVVKNLIPNSALKDLYMIRNYLASTEKGGKLHDKLNKLLYCLESGNLNY